MTVQPVAGWFEFKGYREVPETIRRIERAMAWGLLDPVKEALRADCEIDTNGRS
jgi:hypothetical protein